MAALSAARKISSGDPRLNLVMQEVSLCLATSGLSISLLEHTRVLQTRSPTRFQGNSSPQVGGHCQAVSTVCLSGKQTAEQRRGGAQVAVHCQQLRGVVVAKVGPKLSSFLRTRSINCTLVQVMLRIAQSKLLSPSQEWETEFGEITWGRTIAHCG